MAQIVQPPLVVIVGPTASGKTGLALELAQAYRGEIICADSRTIFRGMDVGTAKPTQAEQALVPHWGLDLVEPGEYYSVAEFQAYTQQKISEIRARGNVPFLVGGTGLYIDAVVFSYEFGPPVDQQLRTELQQLSLEQLHDYCNKNNIQLPENKQNKRYVIRAIETRNSAPRRQSTPLKNTIIVGIATDKAVLRLRIEKRTEQLFQDGVVQEATVLGKKYGWDNQAMTSNIYPLLHKYLVGSMALDVVRTTFITQDWRLAKRQLTWLRRNNFIHWQPLDEARIYLATHLAIYG